MATSILPRMTANISHTGSLESGLFRRLEYVLFRRLDNQGGKQTCDRQQPFPQNSSSLGQWVVCRLVASKTLSTGLLNHCFVAAHMERAGPEVLPRSAGNLLFASGT